METDEQVLERLTKKKAGMVDEVRMLKGEVETLEAEIDVVRSRLSSMKYGVKVDDVVRHADTGVEYRVSTVNGFLWPGRSWLEGNPRKADGKFGTRVVYIGTQWEIVKP